MEREMRRSFLGPKSLFGFTLVLVSPREREMLTLYLIMFEFSINGALVMDKEKVQQPVYFYRKAPRGAEEWYSKMENLVLALLVATRRLRPYFQAHIIYQPMR